MTIQIQRQNSLFWCIMVAIVLWLGMIPLILMDLVMLLGQRIEGLPEGGSTSSSNKREGDRAPEGSQEPGTTSEQVERTIVTDNPNRVNDIAGLQTTGAHEDSDNGGDLDHTSEQGGGPFVPTEEKFSSEDLSLKTDDSTEGTVTDPSDQEDIPTISTGNADNQQTSDDWTIVDHVKSDAETVGKGEICKLMEKSVVGTVGKGEVCRQMEKNSGLINEVQQQITEVHSSLHSDDTPRAKSLKNDRPVVAKVSETGGESAADNASKDVQASETDAQATREESCEASAASCQGLKIPPVAVEFATSEPNLVVFKAQGVVVLSYSRSAKETRNLTKPLETLRPSKSWRDTPNYSKSPRRMIKYSNSPKETSISEEAPSKVSISETKKESNISSEAPSTASTSENQEEVGTSQDDPSSVSGSAALEESSEISEAPSTVLFSGTQKESNISSEAPSTASTSEAQEEVGMSQDDPSSVSGSAALEESSEISEAPSTVLFSGTQKESNISSEAPSTASTSEAQEEVGMSQDDPSSVSGSAALEESSEISEAPSTVLFSGTQKESNISSEAPSTASTSEAQEEVGMSQDDPSSVSGSAALEESSEISEAPSTVLFSGTQKESNISSEAPSTASTSEAQEEVGTSQDDPSSVSGSAALEESSEISEAPSTVLFSGTQKESNISLEAPSTASTSEAQEEVGMSQDDPSSVSGSAALEESSEISEAPSTVLFSGIQKESNISSEAPSTASTSEAQEEVGTSQDDPSSVSGSAALEESSEISEAPSTVLHFETQKEASLGLEDPRTVSRSESLKEVFMSPKAASSVSASEAREGSSVISEAPCSVPTSVAQIVGISQEALSMVSNSVAQKDVDSISEPFSTLSIFEAQEEVSVSSEASRMVSNSEVPNDVGISSDSSSTVPTPEAQEEIRKSSETSKMVPNSEVQNEVGINADAPSRACEAEEEISVSSETPSTMSTSEAQKDFGTSPEEIIPRAEIPSSGSAPERLQRKVLHIGEEKIRNPLPKPPQQSETSVSDVRQGLPRARSGEGKVTSVLKGDARESYHSLTSTHAFRYEEKLAHKDKIIAELDKKAKHSRGRLQGLQQDYHELCNDFEELGKNHAELQRNHAELDRNHAELQRNYQNLNRAYRERETECSHLSATMQTYANSYARLKNGMTRENDEKEKMVRDLRGQLEQMKKENGTLQKENGTLQKENGTLQNQMSLYEQQHANEQSRGGSYLDGTKAATPALLVSALNGVKDASNNFVKVLKNSIQPGIDTAQLEAHIGPVSRNGHIKFQYQAYICRILFGDFDYPYAGSSKVTPMTYFRQYQMHDLKKSDTVERLLRYDREIDGSLHEFCFDKFLKLMVDIQDLLTDKSIDLGKQVQNKHHPRNSKLYVSFCKLAVSVWLLQRLAFSFLHPAKQFVAERGEPFDMNRMQSVVPLDEPSSDEEVQLRVGFYVLPGFDIGNSAIPCEVYVALK